VGIPASLQSNWNLRWWLQEYHESDCDRFWSTWKHLGAPATSLEALATSLGVPWITAEQSGKNNIFFGNTPGAPGHHGYYVLFNDFLNSSTRFVFSSMYLYGYSSSHGISGLAAASAWGQFEVRLKTTIEWTQRYTPRPWSCKVGDALRGHARANLEDVIQRVWRYFWRPWLSEFGDMHLEAQIVWTWRL